MKVTFLCTHNSARSQMAEGLLRALEPSFEVSSAGTEKTRVHPLAVAAMDEIGISLEGHRSKTIDEILERGAPDLVITVCDAAAESCPTLPSATRTIHWSLPDPTATEGSREEQLETFRTVRDDLRSRLSKVFG